MIKLCIKLLSLRTLQSPLARTVLLMVCFFSFASYFWPRTVNNMRLNSIFSLISNRHDVNVTSVSLAGPDDEQQIVVLNETEVGSKDPVSLILPCSEEHRHQQLIVGNFSCDSILFNNSNYDQNILAAKNFMNSQRYVNISDEYFIREAKECLKFKTTYGYRTSPLEDEDTNFPIAYNMLAHVNAAQFERLLRAIYRPQNSYCVHIDKKSTDIFQKAVQAIVKCFENVFIATKLEIVVYAGYSRLQADINCMKDQLASTIRWRYLLNIAATSFPLKTNAEMVKILKIYNGANDIRAAGFSWSSYLKWRWEKEWYERKTKRKYWMAHTDRSLPPPPHNLTIVKGSAYGVFSRNFVEYMINDKVAQDYLKWCQFTFSPDEHYWNTLHHTYYHRHINPPGSYSGSFECIM